MYVLSLNCDDRPGIVAAVATTLCNANCNIEESSQFDDPCSKQFFMRVVFSEVEDGAAKVFKPAFERIAKKFKMSWQLTERDEPVKTLLFVSTADHCLNDLIYRWRTNHLNIDIVGVVSNHKANRKLVENFGLQYYYLPIENGDKAAQEAKFSDLIEERGAELMVLARYMQILSNDFCEKYSGRVINIHHSFLPGFKGARPYNQAYERGVKLIGATAHFATSDLDEGPIIEQDVVRIDHRHCPSKLQSIGQDNEARVLARAIELYTERRVFLHGSRTVIL